MILVLDNYDSFTYNLVQYLGELGEDLRVHRNNKITLDEIEQLKPERIVISPGPGTPVAAGIAARRAAALLRHSRSSSSGTESATMPAPACTYMTPSFTSAVRSTVQVSISPMAEK